MSCKRKPAPSKLDPYIDIIGKMHDADVARVAGVSRERVRQIRKKMGLKITYDLTPSRWGDHSKIVGARNFAKVCSEALRERATMGDVVARSGLSRAAVRSHLKAAGINLPRRDMIFWTDDMLGLLGKIPDDEFSARFGMHFMTVKRKRRALGIPMLVDRRRKHHTNEEAHHGVQHDTRGERGHAGADTAEPGDAG